ncbi:hypothetical protein [Streptomyces sp. 142MFCol3.1]|uniref:hypothetical protein n=1 Tax=Streptomyces sp. 142MFCol3.1 TaxID=1172179 RepID=UPI0003F86E46|nr:hypothetical protein [Streptomyces sp. 142MFCol3.1]
MTRTFENLHGVPHAEIVVFTKDADDPGAGGMVYNTLGLPVDFTDEQFRALDPAALAEEFHGDAAWMNGPRRALMDTATAELRDEGRVTSVEGIAMHTVADIHVPDLRTFLSTQRPPYTQLTVGRTTQWVFLKGSEIHELVSPEGHQYVMQSLSRHVEPDLDVEQLPTLGERLRLPDGWQYRVRTLDEDLRVGAHGDAHIVFDEYENNYQRHA